MMPIYLQTCYYIANCKRQVYVTFEEIKAAGTSVGTK